MALIFENGKVKEVMIPAIKGEEARKVLNLKAKKNRRKKFKIKYV